MASVVLTIAHQNVLIEVQRNVIEAVYTTNVDFNKQDKWGGECNTGTRQSPVNIDTNKWFTTILFPTFAIVTNQNFTALLQWNGIDAVYTTNVDFNKQDKWGGECNTGTRQSPVNIDTRKVVYDDYIPRLKLQNFDKETFAIVTNQNFTAEYNFSGKALPRVSGAGLDGNYTLQGLYFAFPSDHTINGRHYPLEGVWVFVSDKYNDIEEAYTKDDGVVDLSLFYDVGARRGRKNLDQLAEATSKVSKEVFSQAEIKNFVLAIERSSNSFFTYKGSLPVPPCYEGVTFIVLEEPVLITDDEYKKLTTLYNSNRRRVTRNNRRVQPLNERQVRYKYQRNF